ncbi:MAG TPA: M67 family metallopeptidase [Actinomycetota bacterium]
MTIEIPRDRYEEVLAHLRAGRPNEACGVLAGVDGKVAAVYPMRNAEESPVAYRFDEREQIEVFREVEERGWELLAFFHSHTHTEAYPSPTDVRHAHWEGSDGEPLPAYPGTRYVIVSLMGEEPDVRAFAFEGGAPVEEEVRVV